MTRALHVVFGVRGGAHAQVSVHGRGYPGGLGVFDHNWLHTEVAARPGDRPSWRYHAFLRAGDFARFGGELAAVQAGRRAVARFDPRDPWVAAEVQRDETEDGFWCHVRLRDGGSERGGCFTARLSGEQAAALRDQVDAVVARFPVVR